MGLMGAPNRVRISVTLAIVFVVFLFGLLSTTTTTESIKYHISTVSTDTFRDIIPNVVHYNYVLQNRDDFNLSFENFISFYSAWYHWRPSKIYLHVDAPPEAVERARVDQRNVWNRLIFNLPGLKVEHVTSPTHAKGSNIKLQNVFHRADFLKPWVLHHFGGVYLDTDSFPLRDIKYLRESGFANILGEEVAHRVQTGTMMSKRGSKFMKAFYELQDEFYTGAWTDHNNNLLTWWAPRWVKQPGEMLILPQDAFAPMDWTEEKVTIMYVPHPEFPSPLNETHPYTEPFQDDDETADDMARHKRPDLFPDWATDWSHTYVLHAWSDDLGTPKETLPGFSGFTPRNVLARQSSVARAVYPAIKHAYDRGLFTLDDPGTYE